MSFTKLLGATAYEIVVTASDSAQRLRRTTAGATTLRIPLSSAGRVSVRAVGRLRTGPAATASFRRLARPRTRFKALPRAPRLTR